MTAQHGAATTSLSVGSLLDQLGAHFLAVRYIIVPVVLVILVIGVLEKHGLQERAADVIRGLRGATAGRVLLIYGGIRQATVALGIPLGGQASVVRPLIAPMAEAAARLQQPALGDAAAQEIRAHAAATENVGAFFGEDVFVAVGAVLLIKGFMEGIGVEVSLWKTALWGLPTAFCAFFALWWRLRALDRRLARGAA